MPATINFDDLSPEQRRELGLRKPRQSNFGKEEVRSWALKILAVMAGLSREERNRVLRHAAKVNGI